MPSSSASSAWRSAPGRSPRASPWRATRGAARILLRRLADDARVLRQAYRVLAGDVRTAARPSPPAAEWLLDNFHLVEAEIREIRHHLPTRYYRELPKLATRELAGTARVYAMAVELLRYSDARLDRQRLVRFMHAYQTVAPLSIGELWAWPSMLKLALIEHLRRLSEELLESRAGALEADRFLAQFERRRPAGRCRPFPTSSTSPSWTSCCSACASTGRRRRRSAQAVEERLAPPGMTVEDADARRAPAPGDEPRLDGQLHHQPAAVRHARLDAYVEHVSLIEQVLQRDPPGVYARMDFPSRDRYRHAVEELAEPTGEAQVRVALRAVESARQAAEAKSAADRAAHVGYHLIGRGRPRTRDRRGLPPAPRGNALRRLLFAHATRVYLGSVGAPHRHPAGAGRRLVRALGGAALGAGLGGRAPAPPRQRARGRARAARRRRLAPPRRLPRLDLRGGVPETARTMVIVPTLLTSVAGVAELLEHLEVQALGNMDPRIHFAMLTDFPDAPTRRAARGRRDAGRRPRRDRGPQRALRRGPHRTASTSSTARAGGTPGEGVWMGWERKRGKIEEFNRLLRGATDTSFTVQVGDPEILPASATASRSTATRACRGTRRGS